MTKTVLLALATSLSSPADTPACLTSSPQISQMTPVSQTCTYGNCCGQEGCWVTCKCWK